MAYAEFPSTMYEHKSYEELIRTYYSLLGNYEGTLNSITELQQKLDKYILDTNNQISTIESVTLPKMVTAEVTKQLPIAVAYLQQQLTGMQSDLLTLDSKIKQVSNKQIGDVTTLNNRITEVNSNLTLLINNNFQQLNQAISNNTKDIIKLNTDLLDFEHKVINELADLKDSLLGDMYDMIQQATTEWKYMILVQSQRDRAYTDSKVSALHSLIEQLEIGNVLERIKWVWQYGCNYGGYNAFQWYMDSIITCADWNYVNISCVDWYVRGKEEFYYQEREYKEMFNPLTGERDDVRKVVSMLCEKLQINGITAGEYDSTKTTAGEYESMKLTAEEYDWKGRYIYAQ